MLRTIEYVSNRNGLCKKNKITILCSLLLSVVFARVIRCIASIATGLDVPISHA